jgi:glutamate transport system permease protein
MESVIEALPRFVDGFRTTLYLTVVSGVLSLLIGTLLAAFRVSPLRSLRAIGTVFVEIGRNTPLTLVFIFFVFILPAAGVVLPLGTLPAIIALTVYTSSFVCEAVRSGINSVGIGQAEAARAIGLGSIGVLRFVVLPQALRTVVPPLISVLIALAKNTSVASGFAVVELTATGRALARDYPADVIWMLLGVAAFYLLITIPAGYLAGRIERRVVFSR